MKDHRLPKKLLYSELSQRKHSQGGQNEPFKDTLKVSMKSFSIAPNCLEYLAQDREKWREVVKRGAKVFETRINAATELRGKLRKGTATSAIADTIPCFTVQDSSSRRLVICALTDAFLNHKVDQMVFIDYDGQRKRRKSRRRIILILDYLV